MHIKIRAGQLNIRASLQELWSARGLLLTLAKRDFKVRYAQTKLGYIWALIQPLTALAVLYLVFQKALNSDTQGVSFLSYSLSGLVIWNFFSYNLSQGANALIQARAMLQKIYFPRQVLLLSKGLVALSDLVIALILFALIGYEELYLTLWTFGSFLLAIVLSFLAAQGLAFWLAALSLRFRDLQQVVPFMVQMLFFLSPIAYSPDLWQNSLGNELSNWLLINPMYSILEIWRSGVFGLGLSNGTLGIALLYCSFLFTSGWLYFQSVERKMADLL